MPRFIASDFALFADLSDRSQFGEILENSPAEKCLNIYSPFSYLLFEITGTHRIICPLFDA
ncbi:hypothetical protein GM30_01665 [Trabulsiella odontotermitis]|nr:hypothetical protein GM30_01665 [Trabulsiella odontotermitis]